MREQREVSQVLFVVIMSTKTQPASARVQCVLPETSSTSSRYHHQKKGPIQTLEQSHGNNQGANPTNLRTVSNFQGTDLRQRHSCCKQDTAQLKMSKRKEKHYVCGPSEKAVVTRPGPTEECRKFRTF